MTDRERLLAILAGHSPDRIPWIPRLQIWYEAQKRRGTLPARYEGWTLRQIERDLGLGTPAREGRVFRIVQHDVEVHTHEQGNEIQHDYVTPVGTVSTRHRRSEILEQGGISGGRHVEYMIKGPDDYAVVEYMIQHTDIVPTYDEYMAYEREIGEDGVPLVNIGAEPMSRIIRDLIGYNQAFYHLHDYPDQVHHLLGVIREQTQDMHDIALDSPAKLLLHGEHFDSHMTPPPFFAKYMLSWYQALSERLHGRGKVLAVHADADASLLLDLIAKAGIDMVECFVTAPMVPLTLERARAAWGTQVIIWGGIPSVLFGDPVTDDEFKSYVLNLFPTIAPGDAFILGIADNLMAEGKLERVQRVTEMVQEYGQYPIRMR
jgi:uroporphyrinogen-III decarboxylase